MASNQQPFIWKGSQDGGSSRLPWGLSVAKPHENNKTAWAWTKYLLSWWCIYAFVQNKCQFGFARCQMIRLLICWSSQEFPKFRRGAAPPAKRLDSVCGKDVTQRCYYRWHKCSPLLPNLPQFHELFQRSAEFSMRMSDFDHMQDARFNFKPTVQPLRTWTEWPLSSNVQVWPLDPFLVLV